MLWGQMFWFPTTKRLSSQNIGATAEEILVLMAIAKEKVQNRYGIFLENEIQLLF
ncbi:MAG: hypothetical protein AAB474_01060 [Patescibacteria group bacterium]